MKATHMVVVLQGHESGRHGGVLRDSRVAPPQSASRRRCRRFQLQQRWPRGEGSREAAAPAGGPQRGGSCTAAEEGGPRREGSCTAAAPTGGPQARRQVHDAAPLATPPPL